MTNYKKKKIGTNLIVEFNKKNKIKKTLIIFKLK